MTILHPTFGCPNDFVEPSRTDCWIATGPVAGRHIPRRQYGQKLVDPLFCAGSPRRGLKGNDPDPSVRLRVLRYVYRFPYSGAVPNPPTGVDSGLAVPRARPSTELDCCRRVNSGLETSVPVPAASN